MTIYHPKDDHFQSVRAAIEGRPEREPDDVCADCGAPIKVVPNSGDKGRCDPCRKQYG